MVDVCVSLVNTNEREDIERCLASLYADTANISFSLHIVIVDNASTDNIAQLLKEKFSKVQLLRQEKNMGFGASHNRVLKEVDAKYFFILNPDTIFLPAGRIIEKMYAWMEVHPAVGMMGPKVIYPDGSLQLSCYRFPTFLQPIYSRTKLGKSGRGKEIADHFVMKKFDHNSTLPVDWIMGSAMFVRGEAIKKSGVFDERYWMYAEDSDLCRRLWEANWPIYYVHDIVIQHFHRRSSAKVPGIINALVKNKFARVHIMSWCKYFLKWHGNHKYYGK